MTILVFGSINMDLVARVDQFPQPGETITGSVFNTAPGGKGANQAVACARLGASTRMIGRVGSDYFGKVLKDHLSHEGVDVSGVHEDPSTHSGVAMILVNRQAENNITIIPGSNGAVGQGDLARLEAVLSKDSILLLQLEVPLEAVIQAAEMAHARGAKVILDPAPARALPEALYRSVDFLTPNLGEAATLVGFNLYSDDDVLRASQILRERGTEWVMIKMGEKGVFAAGNFVHRTYPAIPVKAVDTVAAGDAFNGALAAAMDSGLPVDQAIEWGLAGGAWAVTRTGAQDAMPYREDIQRILEDRSR
jgi:ribokinase